MKDLNKDFGLDGENSSDNREIKDLNDKVFDNAQNIQNCEESLQENKEISEEVFEEIYQAETNMEAQEKTASEEGEDTSKEDEAAQEKGQNYQEEAQGGGEEIQSELNQQYSSYYTPPYYVPNFTVSDGAANQDNGNMKHHEAKSSWRMLLVLSCVLVVVIAVFLLGALSGSIFNFGKGSDKTVSYGNGENLNIQMVQGAPQITVDESVAGEALPLTEVVQKVGNSVVEIRTSSVVTDRFYGQYVTSGAGSGVIITQSDTAGYLITNHHVISGTKSVVVQLANGEEYEAEIISGTAALDLAIIRIKKKGNESFTTANIGDSSKLIVGQEIVAIGNPLGSLGGTVTDGIISALDRNVSVDGISMTLLQHNAAINPGNSGGALFDMTGSLVGIVNAKTSKTGIEGLGFAIPVNIAFEYFKGVMNSSSIGAVVDYGYDANRIYGVYVFSVTANSQFKRDDLIVKINEDEVKTLIDYYAFVNEYKKGDTIKVTVVRDGKQLVLDVTLN